MKVFVDANVLVSVLNKEYPSFSYSARILSLNDHSPYKIYTSPVCLAIAFYFSEHIHIAETGRESVVKSIANKRIHDFEDGLEYYSALHSGCKCIITENVEDFYFSEIEVLRPKEFLGKYF